MAEPPLPAVDEGLLDAVGLRALLDDIQACTTVREVQVKGGPTRRADAADLHGARRALLAGEVRGVQVRYEHQGGTWCDTVLVTPRGYKVVRIRGDAPG
ncbi:hypothetical protein L6R53_09150 [Myxococcota bacterium]|nr:hypothetical protein [Myxococcota bacterium]